MLRKTLFALFFVLSIHNLAAQKDIRIALLKYNGGGDWYANPTSLPNLVEFCNKNIGTKISKDIPTVEAGSSDIFSYPFVHATGHGNIIFNQNEIANLRTYIEAGGFLHFDDNYGMDKYIRREIKKMFPDKKLVELPPDFEIFHQKYDFPEGLPKIHEHDGKPAQAFGIFIDKRLALLYTYECDLGDGWEDPQVHHDSEKIRLKALRMGANIIQYVFTH